MVNYERGLVMKHRTTPAHTERIIFALTLLGCVICVMLSVACFYMAMSSGGVIA